MPVAVVKHLNLRSQHQALRVMLLHMAEELEKREAENGKDGSVRCMRESLEDGRYVLDEVAMLVMALFREIVTVNVIMAVTTWEALTVTSFPGE